MRRPVNPRVPARQTRRTVRSLLGQAYPWPEPPNRIYDRGDFVELAALATARGQSLAEASRIHHRLPDSDTLHLHLHDRTADEVFQAFQHSLNGMLDVARDLGWLDPAALVAIDRHNEPVYGAEQPWMVPMEEKAGTNRAHAYLTSQRLSEPRLTLDLQRMHGIRDQHQALADLLNATKKRQAIKALLLDKGFYTQKDIQLLIATQDWFVVPIPLTEHVHKWANELYRDRTRLDFGRFIAFRRHRVGHPTRGPLIVQVFVWEPDPEEPSGEALFAYACPQERPLAELNEWARTYRRRWGIETGYRQLEEQRLRTTSHVYQNRLFLTCIAVLLDTAWRLLRHARGRKTGARILTLPQFHHNLLATHDLEVA